MPPRHHGYMREWFPKLLILGCIAWSSLAGAQKTLPSPAQVAQAEAQAQAYRARNGVDPQLLQFMSEIARTKLELGQVTAAQDYARQTEQLCRQQLTHRAMDAEPRLPLALGAAIEVQGQALAQNGNRSAALALLRQALRKYGTTSLQARLQKNLNLLTLEGRPAPPLVETQYIGPKPPSLSALRGRPVLLFFWAHWCADCKHEEPVISRLVNEYGRKGLVLLGPTQRYGYAAYGEPASPPAELQYIDSVRRQYYADLSAMPVPVSKLNFDRYGASTTPTLVLIDRRGDVAMYHPGVLSYDELRAEIEKVIAPSAAMHREELHRGTKTSR
ncbi:MAG TPA: TlpA disulfide reductase family protein [Terriglobales bacterium]|nr:TlpA disulfide reductase family protein [Terriglobales bacterium]